MAKAPVLSRQQRSVLDFAVAISSGQPERVTLTVVPCDYTRHGTPKVIVLVRGQRQIEGGPGYVRRVLRTVYGATAEGTVARAEAFAEVCRQYLESKTQAKGAADNGS